MLRFGWVLGALALVACKGDKEGGDDSSEPVTCTVQVSDTLPSSGEEFYYRGTIEIKFSAADSEGEVMLMDSAGAEVAGTSTWSDDGLTLYFEPSEALAPSSDYTIMIHYCGGDPEVAFRTSELGAAVTSASLAGKAYVIDLGSARFIEPGDIGSLIGEALEQNILVGVVAADDTTVQMIGAISEGASETQDVCTPSIDFPEADFSENPFFAVGPEDTTISVAGYTAEIGDLEISGAFSPDMSYFGGGRLGGVVDTRQLDDIEELASLASCDGTDDACLCNFIGTTGFAECGTCPDDGQPYCLTLLADQIVAVEIETGLVPISEDDIAANPECAD